MSDESDLRERMKHVDQLCTMVNKVMEHETPDTKFNVAINLVAECVNAADNSPLVLGMVVLGLSQALMLKHGELIDCTERESDARKSKPTH